MGINGVQSLDGGQKDEGAGRSDQYKKLLDLGLVEQVAAKLDVIYSEGLVKHEELDERAFDALKEFDCEGACSVLQQFKDSNLSHVHNKSAFLCGVMKTYRQRQKAIAEGRLQPQQQGHPDEGKIKELLVRTNYNLDVTTGQRKYGGPPPASVCHADTPPSEAEVFIGKIPRDMFEDELVPLFEKCGPIWDFRLMMDPMTGQNRGYAFLSFLSNDSAKKCVQMYDRYEIRNKRELHVTISQPNNRLFVGSIPKTKTKDEIFDEFHKHTTGLTEVILYYQVDEKTKNGQTNQQNGSVGAQTTSATSTTNNASSNGQKNRGFCFLEYDTHQAASQARRRLLSGRVKAWNNLIVTVDWADPINSPASEIMDKVKVLYVKNLASSVTEESLVTTFSAYGEVEKAKKLKDYAFVHFAKRDDARKAMEILNGLNLEGQCIEICLAKPQDKKLKEKKLERQMQKQMAINGGFGFSMGRPGFPGVPRFPGPWNMHSGYGNGGGGYGGPHTNGYHNHNGFGNENWNEYGGFGYPMEKPFYGGMAGPNMNNRGGGGAGGGGGGRGGGVNNGYNNRHQNGRHSNNGQNGAVNGVGNNSGSGNNKRGNSNRSQKQRNNQKPSNN